MGESSGERELTPAFLAWPMDARISAAHVADDRMSGAVGWPRRGGQEVGDPVRACQSARVSRAVLPGVAERGGKSAPPSSSCWKPPQPHQPPVGGRAFRRRPTVGRTQLADLHDLHRGGPPEPLLASDVSPTLPQSSGSWGRIARAVQSVPTSTSRWGLSRLKAPKPNTETRHPARSTLKSHRVSAGIHGHVAVKAPGTMWTSSPGQLSWFT